MALVIGLAFATLLNSFVGDILTPLLGLIGVPDFLTLTVAVGSAEVRYGAFLNALIAFLPMAAVIYLFVVKPMERMKGTAAVTTKACTECTSEIPLGAKRCPMCTAPRAA